MNKGIILYGILILFWSLILIIACDDDKKLWGKIDSPDLGCQVYLYQKDRIMHQAPEILVYFQKKGSSIMRPIGNILLPEDNRSTLTYAYEWEKGALNLSLNCEQCMIEQRNYKVRFEGEPCLSEIIDNPKKEKFKTKYKLL